MKPQEPLSEVKLTVKEHAALNAQAGNYRVILRLLKESGIDNFIAERNLPAIDLLLTPDDTTGGMSVNVYLKSIADECNRMDQKIQSLSEALVDTNIALAKEKRKTAPKQSIFSKIKAVLFYRLW